MKQVSARRRGSQGGFALLLVFLMAAIIAMMLYQQLPRVAFESEREKEQLLIDRGEQYTRAIQLYYLANNRQYPTSIDDLEKREKRFLRRRFVDPYTGKDEWRIVHTNGGFLTDSLVQKPPTEGDGKSLSASSTTNSTSNTSSTNPADQGPQVNAAVLQRPSDRAPTPLAGFEQPGIIQDPAQAQPINQPLPPITLTPQQGGLPPITLQGGLTNQPGGLPPITLVPGGGQQGAPQIPGQIPGQIQNPNRLQGPGPTPGSQFPGQPGPTALGGGIQSGAPPGFRIDANGQLVPAQNPGQTQAIPGQPLQSSPFNQPINQPINQPLNPVLNQAGAQQGNPNPALNAINQLLTNQRQTTTPTQGLTSGNQVGAIAGIASTHKGPSIKVYKDQTKYEMWEFVFSPTAGTVPGAGAVPNVPPNQNGSQNGGRGSQQPNGPPTGTNPFGNSFGGGPNSSSSGPGR